MLTYLAQRERSRLRRLWRRRAGWKEKHVFVHRPGMPDDGCPILTDMLRLHRRGEVWPRWELKERQSPRRPREGKMSPWSRKNLCTLGQAPVLLRLASASALVATLAAGTAPPAYSLTDNEIGQVIEYMVAHPEFGCQIDGNDCTEGWQGRLAACQHELDISKRLYGGY